MGSGPQQPRAPQAPSAPPPEVVDGQTAPKWVALLLILCAALAPLPSSLARAGQSTVYAAASSASGHSALPAPAAADADPSGQHAACLSAQLALVRAGRLEAALDEPPAPQRRPLVAVVRIFEGEFAYAPALLHARLQHADAGYDLALAFLNEASHAGFTEYLAAQGFAHLAEAYVPLLLSDWLTLTINAQGKAEYPPGELVYPVGLKMVVAWAALHACYDLVVAMDADSMILRPDTFVAAVRAKLQRGLVFTSIIDPGAQSIVLGSIFPLFRNPNATLAREWEDTLNIVTTRLMFSAFFADVLAYDARDLPQFVRDMGHPRTSELGGHMCFLESAYDYWKILRSEWRTAPGYVQSVPGNADQTSAGMVWKMKRGEDWYGFLSAYGHAPMWASLDLCRESPEICVRGWRARPLGGAPYFPPTSLASQPPRPAPCASAPLRATKPMGFTWSSIWTSQ